MRSLFQSQIIELEPRPTPSSGEILRIKAMHIITALTEMLELPNFGLMTQGFLYVDG